MTYPIFKTNRKDNFCGVTPFGNILINSTAYFTRSKYIILKIEESDFYFSENDPVIWVDPEKMDIFLPKNNFFPHLFKNTKIV